MMAFMTRTMNLTEGDGNLLGRAPAPAAPQIMRHFFLVLSTLLWLCSACHDDPPVVYPTTAPLDVGKLSLGPGDKLNLTVFYGSHSFQAAYTLDSSGAIAVQYI